MSTPNILIGLAVTITMPDGVSCYNGTLVAVERKQVNDEFNHRTRRWTKRTEILYVVQYVWENGMVRTRSFKPDDVSFIEVK